jgi:iron complex outermembrane receptor protein
MLKLAKLFRFLLPISAVVLVAPGLTSVAQAQEGADEVIEEIITTGTRRAQRSAADSSIPIDVISGGELENVGPRRWYVRQPCVACRRIMC